MPAGNGGAAVPLLLLITLFDKIFPLVLSMVPSLLMVPLLTMVSKLVNVTVELILSVCVDRTVNDDPAGKVKSAVIVIVLLTG